MHQVYIKHTSSIHQVCIKPLTKNVSFEIAPRVKSRRKSKIWGKSFFINISLKKKEEKWLKFYSRNKRHIVEKKVMGQLLLGRLSKDGTFPAFFLKGWLTIFALIGPRQMHCRWSNSNWSIKEIFNSAAVAVAQTVEHPLKRPGNEEQLNWLTRVRFPIVA